MDAWYAVTLIGEPTMWALSTVILAIAYLVLRKKLSHEKKRLFKKVLRIYIPGVITALLLVLVIKNIIFIERPCAPCAALAAHCNPYCDTDSSFPSGHSAAIFAVVTSLYLSLGKKRLLPLYVISFLVASSRYFLGVHRVVDIIGGAAIGIGVPAVFLLLYRKEHEKSGK